MRAAGGGWGKGRPPAHRALPARSPARSLASAPRRFDWRRRPPLRAPHHASAPPPRPSRASTAGPPASFAPPLSLRRARRTRAARALADAPPPRPPPPAPTSRARSRARAPSHTPGSPTRITPFSLLTTPYIPFNTGGTGAYTPGLSGAIAPRERARAAAAASVSTSAAAARFAFARTQIFYCDELQF